MPVISLADAGDSPTQVDGEIAVEQEPATFEEAYDLYFDFVWRNVRRLGVPDAHVDDAVQEVFVVLHRKSLAPDGLAGVARGATLRAWLFGVLARVASQARRTLRRKSPLARSGDESVDPDQLSMSEHDSDDAIASRQAAKLVHEILETLDEDKRTVFILAELEQMTAPEIAVATSTNVNTVYARLRAARKDFELAVTRLRARDAWRER
jgi:RNA polymerase sigma-70 factor (ECF subfamily)